MVNIIYYIFKFNFSLFCDKISKTPEDCLKHCKDSHNFDLMKIKSDWNLDLYSTIKLVNYTRQQVRLIHYGIY